jgi:hypothetical protein
MSWDDFNVNKMGAGAFLSEYNTASMESPDIIRKIARAAAVAWVIGFMLLSWIVCDGPVVSSIVKRVGPLHKIQREMRTFFGWPGDKK